MIAVVLPLLFSASSSTNYFPKQAPSVRTTTLKQTTQRKNTASHRLNIILLLGKCVTAVVSFISKWQLQGLWSDCELRLGQRTQTRLPKIQSCFVEWLLVLDDGLVEWQTRRICSGDQNRQWRTGMWDKYSKQNSKNALMVNFSNHGKLLGVSPRTNWSCQPPGLVLRIRDIYVLTTSNSTWTSNRRALLSFYLV